eukprot:1392643-Amorphochlora_amoeboformis.AAC.2
MVYTRVYGHRQRSEVDKRCPGLRGKARGRFERQCGLRSSVGLLSLLFASRCGDDTRTRMDDVEQGEALALLCRGLGYGTVDWWLGIMPSVVWGLVFFG